MPQQLIDLDKLMPDAVEVKIDDEIYELPGDIPIPEYLEMARQVDELWELRSSKNGKDGERATELLEDLYENVLELFRIKTPDLERLPLGPARLGALVIQIYSNAADADEEEAKPARPKRAAGTRSTSRKKPSRSRGSKS